MTRFRDSRGWVAALLLLPATALIIGISAGNSAAAQPHGGSGVLDASSKLVRPHEKITLRGRFRPEQANSTTAGTAETGGTTASSVKIEFRAFGAKFWSDATRIRATKSGRFVKRIPVRRSGRFRAVSADGRSTRPEKVRVRSVTKAKVEKNAKVGQDVAIKGHVSPSGTRRKVTVRVGGESLNTWTNKSGDFSTQWKPRKAGTEKVRVRAAGNLIAAGSKAKAGSVSVFRPAEASYYGPGLYGNGVACGGTLSPSTMGVANKTLPCGTKLTIRYHGREVTTKVIDRGPYVAGREFDLTAATRAKLGFGGVGTILVNR